MNERSHLEKIVLSKTIVLAIRRELKKKYSPVTFDFEAVKRELENRLNGNQTDSVSESL